MIELVLTRLTKSRAPARKFFEHICDVAQPAFRIPRHVRAEVGIILCGSHAMRTLNRTRRSIDKSTDVLSFPLHMKAITGYTAVLLGDVFICPEAVEQHARESGTSVRAQWSWTVIHGLLHLAGFDHEANVAAAQKMTHVEQQILTRLNR